MWNSLITSMGYSYSGSGMSNDANTVSQMPDWEVDTGDIQ
jgi:hypothetical protein